MKVIVTGANGFLGPAVIEPLAAQGHQVIALYREGEFSSKQVAGIAWEKANLLDQSEVTQLMRKIRPQGLIHLAWDTSYGTYWSSAENLLWIGASLYLFESFARSGGKRLVVAGTSAEYRWGGMEKLDEKISPLEPDSLYGVSKNALRQVVEKWADTSMVSWSWGRIFNMFGEREKKERLIPRVICQLLNNEMVYFDDGLLYRDFLHVEDAGAAFATLFDSNVEGPVNIASGEARTIRQLVQSIAEQLGKPDNVRFDEAKKSENQPVSVVAAVERLRQEVRWRPGVGFEDRLESACNWWQNNI